MKEDQDLKTRNELNYASLLFEKEQKRGNKRGSDSGQKSSP
jgi:hypothetical protein